ncbi:MAG: PTS sugar transporter subunit IIA [Miniphocaeibacter sp.]|uniref:BglG family transcription antiterminator n=1 Tax=Miniphocaeibacter sp. TaxID=3100973 RepID=UPI003BB1AF8A
MKNRQRYILLEILNGKTINLVEISGKLKISDRTIRNDIVDLNNFFERKDYHNLIVLKNSEIFLNKKYLNDNRILYIFDNRSISKYDPDSRKLDILYELLIEENTVSYNKLSEKYYVSKSSIFNDLSEIKKILIKAKLKLLSDNRGTFIVGNEMDKQQLIREIIIEQLTDRDKFKFSTSNNRFLDWINISWINEIRYGLKNILKKKNLIVSNFYIGIVAISLYTLIKRSEQGEKIKNLKNKTLISNKVEGMEIYPFTYEILFRLKDKLNHDFTTDEIYFINNIFMGLGINGLNSLEFFNEDFEKNIKNLVISVERSLGIILSNDLKLINDLKNHLHQMLYRLQSNIRVDNPLLDELKEKYSIIYAIVWLSLNDFISGYNVEISEDEISFIMLHFQAAIERKKESIKVLFICPNGVGTSSLISSQIKRILPSINIYEIISLEEVEDYHLNSIDFIVSTVNIKFENIPTIIVSPVISKEELKKITNCYIDIIYDSKSETNENKLYLSNLPIKVFENQFDNKEKAISYLCNKAKDNLLVNNEYTGTVLNREKLGTTYLKNKIALPHGDPKKIINSFIYILKMENYINWDSEQVDMLILLGISDKDIDKTEKILEFIIDNIDDKKVLVSKLEEING